MNIDVIRSRIEPARKYKWMLVILDRQRKITIPPEYIESVDFSYPDIPQEAVHIMATKRYFPDFSEQQQVSISFYEDTLFSTQIELARWRQLIIHEDGTYGYPSEYKKDMQIHLLDPQDIRRAVVTCIGVFPSNASSLALDYTGSERIVITQQFSVDRLFIGIPEKKDQVDVFGPRPRPQPKRVSQIPRDQFEGIGDT